MKPVSLSVLYDDDSVEVRHSDGSNFQLSPCGSEFMFEKPLPVLAHPLQKPERIRQRTQFVISSYKDQVLQALEFRNRYAALPFLPASIIPLECTISCFADISEVKWPSCDDAAACGISLENGNVKVSALNNCAHLYMSELQQDFTIEFLCKVSQKATLPFNSVKNTTNFNKANIFEKSTLTSKLRTESGEAKIKNKDNNLWCNAAKEETNPKIPLYCTVTDEFQQSSTKQGPQYTWVVQHCSVSSCPEEWKYPLFLALNYYHSLALCKLTKFKEGNDTQTRVTKPSRSVITMEEDTTVLPRALLLSCHASYLHRWSLGDLFPQRKQDLEQYSRSGLLKVVYYGGITYRFFHGTMNVVEIYPGDGSIFISQGTSLGHYFTCYSVQRGTHQREEKMYIVSSLPPDTPGCQYSVRSIIMQALRMLEHCYKAKLSLNHECTTCCWRQESLTGESGTLPVLLEQTIIPNLGRFTAYSDNKVLVAFFDGMILHMIWDFSLCYERTLGHETDSFPISDRSLQGAAVGWCQLIFPDGENQIIQIDCPGHYASYVQTAVAWCQWLNEHVQRKASAPSTEENWSAAAELEKIQRFQFLLENSNVPRNTSNTKTTEDIRNNKILLPEYSALPKDDHAKIIEAVLKQTSQTIQDIECLVSSSFRK